MSERSIEFPTMTYAIRGIEQLKRHGIPSRISKKAAEGGCVYILLVKERDYAKVLAIMQEGNL